MKGNSHILYVILAIVSGCTILSDEDLKDLPENIKLNKIDLHYANYTNNTNTSQSIVVTESDNTIELDWPEGAAVFFYDKSIKKTVYELNTNGRAEKITNTFVDGTVMEDVLKYNDSDQVIELSNSFFNDHYIFYYKNDQLDSVAKTRTNDNVTLNGFYRWVYRDQSQAVYNSIFPFDENEPYQLFEYLEAPCSPSPLASNEFNRSSYQLYLDYYGNYSYGYNTSFYTNESLNCGNQLSQSTYQYSNYYGKINYQNYYGQTYYGCTSCDVYYYPNILNSFLMYPDLFPDVDILNMINSENELKWIYDNIDSPSSQPDEIYLDITYNYEATI